MANLIKVVSPRRKRLGLGYGSGKGGHTSSRGQKGQKSRGSMNILFEGMKVKKSLLHRLPFQRGKDKFKASPKPMAIKLGQLEAFTSGSQVTLQSLVEKGVIAEKDLKIGVKILGGEIKKKLVVLVPTSKSAREAIEKAGGRVEELAKKSQEA